MRRSVGKGGRKPTLPPLEGAEDPDSLVQHMLRYLTHLAVVGQSPHSVVGAKAALGRFIRWCQERSVTRPSQVDRPMVERYQHHLFHHRKRNGEPMAAQSQKLLLSPVRLWFHWLVRQGHLLYSPAADLELPRVARRLPKAILSAQEAEAVLAVPDVTTPTGLRDRAILETLYSTGMRRMELTRLSLHDLDRERGTVMIREGKGKKDRLIPIGERALAWIAAYRDRARPELVGMEDDGTLFLNGLGNPLKPFHLTVLVKNHVTKAAIGKEGACHLFRHTMATLMLENGADTRYIQAMLGHASLETTQIYVRVSIRALKAIHTATHPGKLPEAGRRWLEAELDPAPEDLLVALAEGNEDRP
jgi:integrase/recombinase XerD